MRRSLATAGVFLVALNACSDADLSAPDQNADIAVALPVSEYNWDDILPGDGLAIQATLTNRSTRTYFARLGDGFNTADEQELLYVASGSDAFLEHAQGSNWVSVERATLIEGVKIVTLAPAGSYTLMAYVLDGRITGTFRLRVVYTASPGASEIAGEAVSGAFTIR